MSPEELFQKFSRDHSQHSLPAERHLPLISPILRRSHRGRKPLALQIQQSECRQPFAEQRSGELSSDYLNIKIAPADRID